MYVEKYSYSVYFLGSCIIMLFQYIVFLSYISELYSPVNFVCSEGRAIDFHFFFLYYLILYLKSPNFNDLGKTAIETFVEN